MFWLSPYGGGHWYTTPASSAAGTVDRAPVIDPGRQFGRMSAGMTSGRPASVTGVEPPLPPWLSAKITTARPATAITAAAIVAGKCRRNQFATAGLAGATVDGGAVAPGARAASAVPSASTPRSGEGGRETGSISARSSSRV